MFKKNRTILKALLILAILIITVITTAVVVGQFRLNQISSAFVNALETKDISFLESYISDGCQISFDNKVAFFQHENKDFEDTVIFNIEYDYTQITYLGRANKKLFSPTLIYHVTALNKTTAELPKDNLLSYYIELEAAWSGYKITSIQIEG